MYMSIYIHTLNHNPLATIRGQAWEQKRKSNKKTNITVTQMHSILYEGMYEKKGGGRKKGGGGKKINKPFTEIHSILHEAGTAGMEPGCFPEFHKVSVYPSISAALFCREHRSLNSLSYRCIHVEKNYTYIYVNTHVKHIYRHIHIHDTYTHVCNTRADADVHKYVCVLYVHVYMYIHMYVYYIYMYMIHRYVHIYVYTHIYLYIRIHIYTCIYQYI